MNLLFYLLDSPGLVSKLGVGFLFIGLPVAALVLLIWLFIRKKNKNN